MSVKINDGNIISITRGDDFFVPLFINCGKKVCPQNYHMQPYDALYVSVMEPNQPFDQGVIRQVITSDELARTEDGLYMLHFYSEDTENLLPGRYYLEIKLRLYNNNICTIVNKAKFYIYD